MATAITSSLIHGFPFHNDSQALRTFALVLLIIAVVVFVFNVICMVFQMYLYPKVLSSFKYD